MHPERVPEKTTLLSLHYHIVFSTYERRPIIRTKWRAGLHSYLGGTTKGLGAIPQIIGGVEDHVHLLVGLKATHCLADFLCELKKSASSWAAKKYDPLFQWQEGYAAFTVSATHLKAVRNYIANQEDHHHKATFKEELKRLLQKNDVKYNPKYLL